MKNWIQWQSMFKNWQDVLKVSLLLLAIFAVMRLGFVGVFGKQMGADVRLEDFWLCFYRGGQFDGRIITMVMLPFLILGIFISPAHLRPWLRIVAAGLGSLTVILGFGNYMFFSEYHDVFNVRVFELYYDDFWAIIRSAWGAYPVFWLLILAALLTWGIFWLVGKLLKTRCLEIRGLLPRLLLVVIMGLLVVGGIRGSYGRRPLQRKDVAITGEAFLNKIVPNHYYSVYFAWKDLKKQHSGAGIETFLKDGDLSGALKRLYPSRLGDSLESYFKREVPAEGKFQAKHVFLIVMESQDSWPMREPYRELGLMRELEAIAQKGVSVEAFVSAGEGTMPSLNALIAGVPDMGVHTNYQPSARTPYATSLPKIFKTLGYETNLFYGGYLSWQRLGDFARDQGFDAVYGGADMGKWEGNEWGVHDRQLFDFILKTVKADVPSFNLIMTTSNHPRYVVDLESEGCPVDRIPEGLKSSYDGAVSLRVLGHFWYADKCVGEFVSNAEASLGSVLFAITADHWSRHFLNVHPSLSERRCVPCVFYGEGVEVSDSGKGLAGSHLDIGPTLVELVAPRGFEYHSLGQNLLGEDPPRLGVGAGVVVSPRGVVSMGNPTQEEGFDGVLSAVPGEIAQYYNDIHAVGWAEVMGSSAGK